MKKEETDNKEQDVILGQEKEKLLQLQEKN